MPGLPRAHLQGKKRFDMTQSFARPFRGRRSGIHRGAAAAVALALLAAACGSDDDDDAASEPSTVETAATETSDSALPTAEATAEVSEEPSASITAELTEDLTAESSESSATTSGEESEPAGPELKTGGKATMVQFGSLVSMDPSLHRVGFAFAEAAIMASIFGHLAYMNPQNGEVELYFLETLEPSDDFSMWTMKLHDGIKFSDGTPLDAEAIKYNIDRSANPETGSRFQRFAEVLELEVLDDLTLQVTLPEPNPGWAGDLVANFAGIGSPTAIQASLDAGEEVGQNPVGAGPFMLKDWEPGQTITVERNPYFAEWRPGRPYLDELTFESVPDRVQHVASLTTGAAQIAGTIGGTASASMEEEANAIISRVSGGAVINLNTQIPPFDDIRARKFMQIAFDRSLLAEANAPGTPVIENVFVESSPYYSPEYDLPAQDKEEAQRILDELAAEGKPLSFNFLSVSQPDQNALYNALTAQLADYSNVSIDITVMTPTEQIAASTNGEYQALPFGMYVVNPVPGLYQQVLPTGFLNYGRWSNDVVNAALEDFKTATTFDEQKAIWDVVQEQMLIDPPVVFLDQAINTVGYADGFYVPRTLNLGTLPLWEEVGYTA
jgi:peptide/nickel transport system substrate-binding protein